MSNAVWAWNPTVNSLFHRVRYDRHSDFRNSCQQLKNSLHKKKIGCGKSDLALKWLVRCKLAGGVVGPAFIHVGAKEFDTMVVREHENYCD